MEKGRMIRSSRETCQSVRRQLSVTVTLIAMFLSRVLRLSRQPSGNETEVGKENRARKRTEK